MAYAASDSLMDVLERFYHSPDRFYHVLCSESQQILENLHDMAKSMRDFDFDEVHPAGGDELEKQIRDGLWRAEDVIESHWLSLYHASKSDQNFFQDIQEVVQEIESGMKKMKTFADNHKRDYTSLAASSVLSSIDDSPPKMVGLDEELDELKRIILRTLTAIRRLGAMVVHGMGGIGKTSLAISFYNDSDVRDYFSIGAWVKISLQHCVRDILLSLLHTIEVFDQNISSYGLLIEDNVSDEVLENIVRERLLLERYLVVVDCLCEMNTRSWSYIKSILPDSNNGSRIILVNRWSLRDKFVLCYFHKNFMDTSHSWELLRERVFGDEQFPHALERIGKKIAKNCQGLPLAIITVGFHLAKEEKTVEYWNKIADSGNSIAYVSHGALMFEQLGLSYKQLPQFLRPVFLYLGTFAESYRIRAEEFMNLMVAEGFVGQDQYGTIEELNSEWIQYFLERNLILINESIFFLHHTLWYLCRDQAHKDEFFHVMNMHNDWEDLPPSVNISSVRRLVVSKNVLLGVKNIFKLEHSVLSRVRSILLTGPDHPYSLTINWGRYKMLRVLNACSIHFYKFPTEILNLILLRYVALTLNRVKVPCGISRLRNLQFLIVLSLIKVVPFGETPSYLPIEIWGMQQLIYLEVEGIDLPIPPQYDGFLPNLLSLWSVSPRSCTKEVLERIPNLRQLGIVIDLPPQINVGVSPLCPLGHLIQLQQLKQLFCKISNPYFEGYPQLPIITMPETVRVSLNTLTYLTLNGCGSPWKNIKQITRLPALKYLSLKHHAFRGPKWKLSNKRFKRLEFLVLEDLDIVYWTARSGEFFRCLRELRITRCHKLQQLPSAFKHCHELYMIKVVDSNREVETWARSIRTEPSPTRNRSVVISSPRGKSSSSYI